MNLRKTPVHQSPSHSPIFQSGIADSREERKLENRQYVFYAMQRNGVNAVFTVCIKARGEPNGLDRICLQLQSFQELMLSDVHGLLGQKGNALLRNLLRRGYEIVCTRCLNGPADQD